MSDPAQTSTGRFVHDMYALRADDLPHRVVEHTKLTMLDAIGALLGATSDKYPIKELLIGVAEATGGRSECRVLGTDIRTDVVTASLLNGTLAYYGDIESHHPGANVHAIAVVLPSALAAGERAHSSGKELIAAVVAGVEAAARVSYALGPGALYARGFHPSTIAGTFGAAVAAGRLLGLTEEQALRSFGIAGNATSGLLAWVDDPTEQSRPLNIGLAAQNGTQAAFLASLGLRGAEDIFGGKYPLGAAFTGQWNEEALFAQRDVFEVENLFFKRLSTCVFIPAGVDGLQQIMREEALEAGDIDRVTVRAPKSSYHVIDGNPLRSHNAQYVLSVVAHQGDVQFDDIVNDRREDPAVDALFHRIELLPDESLDAESAPGQQSVASITTVRTRSGGQYQRHVQFPLGAPQNPLSQQQLRAKFTRLTDGVISAHGAEQIMDAVVRLDEATDIGALTALMDGSS